MATPVIMPKQGQSVESCIITKWHKNVGDKVSVGDILFSYETDKASFEEEAKTEGTMLAMFFEEGDDVECLLNVCVIGNEGEDFAQFDPNGGGEAAKEETTEQKTEAPIEQVQTAALAEPVNSGEFVKISPRAKNLADKSGADIRYAQPTGPNGRIIERDVENVIAQGKMVTPGAMDEYSEMGITAEGTGIGGRVTTFDLDKVETVPVTYTADSDIPEFEEVKLTNIRKIIAKSMHASLANSAQLTLNSSFDATDILAFRKNLKENAESMGLPNITLNDIVIYAVSRALIRHREINSHFMGETLKLFNTAHIGVACDTPRGLMVPTMFGADKRSLADIAVQSKALTTACKDGSISPDLLTGGTFTITNLGTLGVESFTPVLNPPQSGILGVCGLVERTKNGVPYKAMGLSLTFDHRAIDGADAARFLQDVIKSLENFSLSLVM